MADLELQLSAEGSRQLDLKAQIRAVAQARSSVDHPQTSHRSPIDLAVTLPPFLATQEGYAEQNLLMAEEVKQARR